MRLTKAQRRILAAVRDGRPFCEFVTQDPRRIRFRTLGEYVPGKLNYILDGKRVAYRTFVALFKSNLIQPSRYKGSPSPQGGITQFHLTERGLAACGRPR